MGRDILWAWRRLGQYPLFAAAVIAILGLGIGANTAVFTIVDAVLLRPLPYASADRLVRIEESVLKRPNFGIPAQDYFAWRARTDLFAKVAAHQRDIVTVTGAEEPEQVTIQRISDGLFPLVDARAQLGRALVDSDTRFGAPNAAVLSDRLWRQLFHADPGVLGRVLEVGGEPYTVVGVMPRDFEFPYPDAEIWVPLRLPPSANPLVEVAARLRPGIGLAQAQGAMEVEARRLEQQEPQKRAGLRISVTPWQETVARRYEQTLLLILAAVGLVLLIGCADVGGLLLSRAVERRKEIAIRVSLGAGFGRVARQLLAESLLLAICGSAAGLAVARYTLRLLLGRISVSGIAVSSVPIVVPHLERVALNGRALAFNGLLCAALACLCSLAPLRMARKTDLEAVLRTGHGGGSRGATRLFGLLIGTETAFAFLLLVGSGLMLRSLVRLEQADHGFHPDHVLTVRVPIGSRLQTLPAGKYDTKPRQIAYYHQILERLQRIPGVRAAALTNNLPLSGANTTVSVPLPGAEQELISTRTVSSDYFRAMGIPLLAGRTFTDADDASAPRVHIVNEHLARQLYPDRDPLTLPGINGIVGVVKDSSQGSIEQTPKGEMYMPYQQLIFGVFLTTFVVRTAGDPMAMAGAVRNEIRAVDPDQPIVKVEAMDDVIADSIWRPRFSAWIFSVLGSLALLLTAAGVYSVVAYTSTLRAREVGIRVALGATPGRVAGLVLRDALAPLAAGLAVSAVAALLLSRLLASLLYETSAGDPLTYLGAAVVLAAFGAVAAARPAWKAATGDQLHSLRAE